MRISDWSSDVCSSDLSEGFEIETEISVHALELKMPVAELRTAYGARPEGSASKLSTYRDGWRILKTMINLYRIERPIAFFGALGGMLALIAVILSVPLFLTFFETGLAPRVPAAIHPTGPVLMVVPKRLQRPI